MTTQEFRLTEIERVSSLWTRIRTHLEERLRILREKNDTPLDPIETARVRGEIKAVKQLLDAGEPPAKIGIYD